MTDEVSAPPIDERPRWKRASEQDFLSTDVNAPLEGDTSAGCDTISRKYLAAANHAEKLQQSSEELTFAMLGSIASFQFKPRQRDEPFGPVARFGDRRTAQPSDFVGPAVAMLASQIERIKSPAMRTRLADVVWLLDRKQAVAGQIALKGYLEIVTAVRDGTLSFSSDGIYSYEVAEHLRRAVQIAKAVGWESDASIAVRDLVADLRQKAAEESSHPSFRCLATLDLDYGISAPEAVAAEADQLAKSSDDLHSRHVLLHVAARGYRMGGGQPEADKRLLEAGECLVSIASASGSAMAETSWLEKAIAELHRVPNTRERRRQLKHQLVDAQSRIMDELTRFSHREDISAIVESARKVVSDKPLMEALRIFACLSMAPSCEKLEADAHAQISETPLSAIFASTTYDETGKPVHRDAGMDGGSADGALRRQIVLAERMRRSLVAQGQIEPARLAILEQHYVTEEALGLICGNSPFVPGDREVLFVSGLLHFLRGDMISALHTLVPQLENSLRYVLRMHGHDVTKLNEDMTQQDLSLSALLDRFRSELDEVFGAAMVMDIDNVFNYSGGPNLRNRVAHGLVPDGLPFGDDSVYACWLIFQLSCIPLLQDWNELAAIYDRNC